MQGVGGRGGRELLGQGNKSADKIMKLEWLLQSLVWRAALPLPLSTTPPTPLPALSARPYCAGLWLPLGTAHVAAAHSRLISASGYIYTGYSRVYIQCRADWTWSRSYSCSWSCAFERVTFIAVWLCSQEKPKPERNSSRSRRRRGSRRRRRRRRQRWLLGIVIFLMIYSARFFRVIFLGR